MVPCLFAHAELQNLSGRGKCLKHIVGLRNDLDVRAAVFLAYTAHTVPHPENSVPFQTTELALDILVFLLGAIAQGTAGRVRKQSGHSLKLLHHLGFISHKHNGTTVTRSPLVSLQQIRGVYFDLHDRLFEHLLDDSGGSPVAEEHLEILFPPLGIEVPAIGNAALVNLDGHVEVAGVPAGQRRQFRISRYQQYSGFHALFSCSKAVLSLFDTLFPIRTTRGGKPFLYVFTFSPERHPQAFLFPMGTCSDFEHGVRFGKTPPPTSRIKVRPGRAEPDAGFPISLFITPYSHNRANSDCESGTKFA